MIKWHDHVKRSVSGNHVCGNMYEYHDSNWLQSVRSRFVSASFGARNSMTAGASGTRLLAQRPQVRFEDGVTIAKAIVEQNEQSQSRGIANVNTIGTIIFRIAKSLNYQITSGEDGAPRAGA